MGLGNTAVFATLATVVAVVGAYLYQKKKKEIIPETWEQVGTLEKLHLYPLKSGRRIELSRAECTESSITQCKEDAIKDFQLRDRALVVYADNENNEYRSARTYPQMVLMNVTVHDKDHVAIHAPTMETLYVKIPSKANAKESFITLHDKEQIYTIDCGDEAAAWLSKCLLGKDSGLRLGYHDNSRRRDIMKTHKKMLDYYKHYSNNSTGLYHDYTSIHLVTQPSVNDLNKRIPNSNITVENFRATFVADGPNLQPYAEDSWDWVKIGDAIFRNVKECTRCMMTTINPENGTRNTNMEPLTTLKKYRASKGPDNGPVLGIHLEVKKLGRVKVGDAIYVAKGLN